MQVIKEWINDLGYKDYQLEVMATDASFRKYYRLSIKEESFVVMDSSEDKDSIYPFIDISVRLLKAKIEVPRIISQNIKEGFLLLSDLGKQHLADMLSPMSVELLYMKGISEIVKMQEIDITGMDVYDKKFLMSEMNLMEEWYLRQHKSVFLSEKGLRNLEKMLEMIADEVLAQPQNLFVHRDFHSRNIMLESGKLALIDYQDAMSGALTYDLVSLLKDVYIEFDEAKINALALEFKALKGLSVSDEEFLRWFDFMALQRHLKILGIFSRLNIRDGKSEYLKDIPLTLKYILEVCVKYDVLRPLGELLKR
ncbi:MAG: COG3178: Predicted phosphotransferase related to Ser/Thr protein kinases [uncultured Sulfurovum sp.]|uniref:COG3178: Predicted phosphotransferase related to Ser/Thr protein kinases n=1 Tax=uncultured Sulfurovum sp. TaxID=269237 RepID=A0A6S6TZ80_9BACT|nr:MAG: COG3178: Predicted phosphotransferase related to Ser/Thr protein kinases [uncultured Sulfurovum sp.]